MNFYIENEPPAAEILEQERNTLIAEIKSLTVRDTIFTFTLIIITSVLLGLGVFWYTDNIRYAGIAVAVFPTLGTLLSLLGITKSTGFRSAANSIAEKHNEFIGLSQVKNESLPDVATLSTRHKLVNEYI